MSDKPKLELMWDDDPETEHERLNVEREDMLRYVAEVAQEVVINAGLATSDTATHYLVEAYVMNSLKHALEHYRTANEKYINSVLGTPKEV
jgi:hypothetical protein